VPGNFTDIRGSAKSGASRFDAKMVKPWTHSGRFAAALILDYENKLTAFHYSRSREREFAPTDFICAF
jgi:hypothetical protein